MKIMRVVVWMASVATMVLGTSVVSGQGYPNKPIRIVAGAAGASTDFTGRLIAQGISGPLGQPVIVENRASGNPRREIVATASPDGYTLLIDASGVWIGTLLEKTPYDPVKDFAPITITDRSPNIVVVNPSLPIKSIRDLIALAKATPKKFNYGSGSTGSSPHLAAELFKAMAGVDMIRVPYKAFGVAVTDLIAGEIQVAFPSPNLVIPHIKSGRLRALAVTTALPSALFPSLPTVAASGLPGYEYSGISAILAPARTPGAIIRRLNQEIVRVLNRNDVKEQFLSVATEVVANSPEQLAAEIRSDMRRMGKVIKDAGIKAD